MKLLIIGSRTISGFDLKGYIPPETTMIISGGAEGIDSEAEHYADRHRLSKLILRPQYQLFGRAAPIRRNEEMVDYADAVLAIWDGVSRGTANTIAYAQKKEKPLTVIRVDAAQ